MTDTTSTGSTQAVPDREAIRAELEMTKADYHELLNSLPEDDWKRKSANSAWTVGQLMWHLGRGMEFFEQAVGLCRQGKAPNPPMWLVNPVNVLITRIGARGATPQSVAEKYDAGHTALVACLDGVREDEWEKSVTAFGNYSAIASTLSNVSGHFKEHEADILKGLGRT